MTDFTAFQSQLGYSFKNQQLLRQALTHRSHSGASNERLEYLGDSVIGFLAADALFARFPKATEGDLTRMRSRLVRNESLAKCAQGLNLQNYLIVGASVSKSGQGQGDSFIADALEAVIAAIYLDSDILTAKAVWLKLFAKLLAELSPGKLKDDKTQLQEHLQKHGFPLPVYEVVKQSGADHKPIFKVTCTISKPKMKLSATGSSRRSAEQKVARNALKKLETRS